MYANHLAQKYQPPSEAHYEVREASLPSQQIQSQSKVNAYNYGQSNVINYGVKQTARTIDSAYGQQANNYVSSVNPSQSYSSNRINATELRTGAHAYSDGVPAFNNGFITYHDSVRGVTALGRSQQVIKGSSRINYVPFQKKVIEYEDKTYIDRVPVKRKVIEYREERVMQTVPREVIKQDYYAVEKRVEYIKEVIPQKRIEMVDVQKKVKRYEYVPVEKQIVHYPKNVDLQTAKGQSRIVLQKQGVIVKQDAQFKPIESNLIYNYSSRPQSRLNPIGYVDEGHFRTFSNAPTYQDSPYHRDIYQSDYPAQFGGSRVQSFTGSRVRDSNGSGVKFADGVNTQYIAHYSAQNNAQYNNEGGRSSQNISRTQSSNKLSNLSTNFIQRGGQNSSGYLANQYSQDERSYINELSNVGLNHQHGNRQYLQQNRLARYQPFQSITPMQDRYQYTNSPQKQYYQELTPPTTSKAYNLSSQQYPYRGQNQLSSEVDVQQRGPSNGQGYRYTVDRYDWPSH